MKRLTVAGMMLGMMLMSVFAFGAGVPQVINYSGTLTNKVGAAVPDGTYDIEFNIYNVPSAGTSLWTEKWSSTAIPSSPVLVTGGVFNVMLGTITPFPTSFFADNPNTYLGIKIGADSEMLPRQKIASVGYAFAAGNGVPKGGVIMWSGTITTIPNGWTLCDGTNGAPDLRDRFVVGASVTYLAGSTGGSLSQDINHTHNDDHQHSGGTGNMNALNDTSVDDNDSSGQTRVMDNIDHSHAFTTNYKSQQGFGATTQLMNQNNVINKLPPYYALAFIMKL